MPHYYVLTHCDRFADIIRWLRSRDIPIDPHLNRTRFVIEDGQVLTEFLLTWADYCGQVREFEDLATGMRWTLDRDLGG